MSAHDDQHGLDQHRLDQHGLDQHRVDDLTDRLQSVIDELDELAFDALREASADGERARPVIDKRLTQARRATERAAHLVKQLGQAGRSKLS